MYSPFETIWVGIGDAKSSASSAGAHLASCSSLNHASSSREPGILCDISHLPPFCVHLGHGDRFMNERHSLERGSPGRRTRIGCKLPPRADPSPLESSEPLGLG